LGVFCGEMLGKVFYQTENLIDEIILGEKCVFEISFCEKFFFFEVSDFWRGKKFFANFLKFFCSKISLKGKLEFNFFNFS